MTLTDLMSGAGLAQYAIVALVLFFAVFVVLVVWVWMPQRRAQWSNAARIPLDEPAPRQRESL